jgi:anti-sigma B factor antagonist
MDDVVILSFTGELDTFNLPTLTEKMEEWIAAGDTRFIFDTRLLTFVNSSGFGYIMNLNKTLADKGGELVLARPSKFIRKIVKMYGVEDYLPLYATVEEAWAHVKGVSEPPVVEPEPALEEPSLQGEVTLLFRPELEGETQPPNKVGRIVSLYPDGLLFHYDAKTGLDPAALDLSTGTTLKLKFRQPFLEKNRYFTMTGKVTGVEVFAEAEDEGPRTLAVRTVWDEISDEDREALGTFAAAQEQWREEFKKKGGATHA